VSLARPCVRGKFLFVDDAKLYVRGVTYGTFAPNLSNELFPEPDVVSADFADMAANGLNAIRTYTVPPRWLLDAAADNGLRVMVGIAWEQHVDFLHERRRARSIEDRIRAGVAACAEHPAVLCYTIGNEIPTPIVRWLGRRRVQRYLARLYRAAKREDPAGLVTYVNYPSTEYLQLPFLDLVCFNVYLETRSALDAYLARLHNVVGDQPLVMAEIGLDSRTHGEQKQADTLDWQIRTAFSSGCAGAFAFAWTDEWYVSYLSDAPAAHGVHIDDWDFGLTRRDREPKPALEAVRAAFEEAPFELRHPWPRISVVVCSFNGEKTLGECLGGLSELDYPDFEVIVVNDGSTDSTPAIASEHGVRLIDTPNRGLASARNTGMQAASGEIVAYLDDDARPDPHWLRYLAATFDGDGNAGVGGPNVVPPGSATLASCVAEAPGGPTHVLVSDREAEHLPGCNMAFRKSALAEVGGFDPQFRVAGDDVDICWRLLASGQRLGFNPAALVWHCPRPSIRGYWRQQRGYGRAEAKLERKWPEKYTTRGHARWKGRLYGSGPLRALGRSRVRYGTWGAELFQSLYGPSGGALSWLPVAPHLHLWLAALVLLAASGLLWSPLLLAVPVLVAALVITIGLAGANAASACSRTPSLPLRARIARWVLATFLHLLQPLARMQGRLGDNQTRDRPSLRFAIPQPRMIKVWAELWRSGEKRLATIESQLCAAGAVVTRGGVYDRWDLDARYSLTGAVRIRIGIEEHGAGRQLVRFDLMPRYSWTAVALIVLFTALSFIAWEAHAHVVAGLLGVGALALAIHAVRVTGIAMGTALGQVRRSEHGRLAVRREHRKLKPEQT
jgi:GT2 family glycosyltransferase